MSNPWWQALAITIRRRLAPPRARFLRWWSSLSPAAQALPPVLWQAVQRFTRYGGQQASALAYYAIFSLFPLTLLITIGVSRLIGPALAQQQVSLGLSALLPPNATDVLSTIELNVQQALEQSPSFTLIALLGLGWAGLGLFAGITSALDGIFEAPARSIWRQRLTAVVMAVVLLTLLALSFVISAVLRLISSVLLTSSFWVNISILALPIGLNLVIFAMLFRYVPARRVHWDAVWPAALFGAIGWELAKAAFSWYLTNIANYQFVYGTLATGIVLLFWAFIIASIFLISAEFCASLNAWYSRFFVELPPAAIPAPRRAPPEAPALPAAASDPRAGAP
jgi:membrane protein